MLAVWCLILTIVGFGWFQNGGRVRRHGEKVIGVGVLVIGLLLFFFRRLSRTRSASIGVRTPTMPVGLLAAPASRPEELPPGSSGAAIDYEQ